MSGRCTQEGCGSYAFNLIQEGIDQGTLCDKHYWQAQATKYREALLTAAQALAWHCFGKCRSFCADTPVLSPTDADKLAKETLED